MPKPALSIENRPAQDNVITLAIPPDAFMTSFMFDQATQAAQKLPVGWFTVALVRDTHEEERRDRVVIARVAGPPVGTFEIRRGTRRRFYVLHKGERGEADEGEKSGPYRTVEAAVEAIRADIELQMEAWGVTPISSAA